MFESRTVFVGIGFLALMLGLFARAVQLQFVQYDRWQGEAVKRHKKDIELTHRRGPILDRTGVQLAYSLDVDSIYADPKFVEDAEGAAKALAGVLDMDPKKILGRLTAPERRFMWIKRRITEEQSRALAGLDLKGVFTVRESDRRYPYGELAAPVIGFVGTDGIGLDGVEAMYDNRLRGEAWRMSVERDASGNVFLNNGLSDLHTFQGGSLRLTIDAQIQSIAEQALAEGVAASGARLGMVLVMDPNTGEILAMAQNPGYDCNKGPLAPTWNRTNHVVVDTFEPGSTLKPFIVAAALQEGFFKPDDIINCEGGSMLVGKHIVRDTHGYGPLTVSQVVQKSSNIGVSKIGFRLGAETLHRWFTRYGFGRTSGLRFPGESAGILTESPSQWKKIHLSNLAFGQGIAVNSLQILTAFSALVNGGSLMRPYLVSDVMDQEGRPVLRQTPVIVERVLSPEISRTITDIMALVTQTGGTGTRASLPGFAVAGKTGTAQKALPNGRGYSPTARVSSFIGAVPAERPRIAAIVVMDEPQGAVGARYGGVCAAPVFRRIAEGVMHYLDAAEDAKEPEKPSSVHVMVSAADAVNAGNTAAEAEEATAIGENMTPNLIGLPINEVVRLAGMAELELRIEGSGISVRQEPSPGTPLQTGREITVVFQPMG